jgi:dCTP deaminase
MAFWSSEKIKQVSSEIKLVDPFVETAIKHGAYELGLGPEAFLTSDPTATKLIVKDGEQLVLPPGQFGLLLTEETVTIPSNAIGFISIKAGIKFCGLVNVSGFHVDPGFSGRLMFSVYNAGSHNIVLERKQRLFLLWFADLDRPTEPYFGEHSNQGGISPKDVMQIQGDIASPGQLKKDVLELERRLERETQRLEGKLENLRVVFAVSLTLAAACLLAVLRGCFSSGGNKDTPARAPSYTTQSNLPGSSQGAKPIK